MLVAAGLWVSVALLSLAATRPAQAAGEPVLVSKPAAAKRPPTEGSLTPRQAQVERLRAIGAAKSWGYQLAGLQIDKAATSPFDLLVVDATTGLDLHRPMRPDEVEQLKRKSDGSRRIVVSYLSIGEAEDYRPDYFSPEYLEEEAPDWLLHENPKWKGNRIIRFCSEGWQATMLGDAAGRSVYNSIEPSPLYRLIELGLDGVYLDRVDVYAEVAKSCANAEDRMVAFVARLAEHARKRNPRFMVVLQNAEELIRHEKVRDAIDAIAKEDLFYGADHTQGMNSATSIQWSMKHLQSAKAAGRAVFVVDYLRDAAKIADAKRRIQDAGFIPYIAPRGLDALWLPGRNF